MANLYRTELKRFKALVNELGYAVTDLRLESQFESLRDWSVEASYEEIKNWFLEQQSNCTMTITDIPLSQCKGWSINEDSGWIEHNSGEFFYVQGVRVGLTKNREVESGWDQPMLTQVGFNGGLLGLLRKRIEGIPHYLIEAKAEPGNPDKVQISPTLQATFSNLKQAHGGKKPKFAEIFESARDAGYTVHFDQWMSEDGGRLHLKCNRGMLVEVPEELPLEFGDSFKWLSLYQIKELIKENSWVNPHVRGIISQL